MNVIIDTNRIIAALLRDGTSRRLLLDRRCTFFSPDFLLSEIEEHKMELRKRLSITVEEFDLLTTLLTEHIRIIPRAEYAVQLPVAKQLISDIDDVPFLALALALNADGIWTDDAHFTQQSAIPVLSTKTLHDLLR